MSKIFRKSIAIFVATGQVYKSMVQFLKGIENKQKQDIEDVFVPSWNSIGTYLGCWNIYLKRSRRDLVKIKDKISSKLAG